MLTGACGRNADESAPTSPDLCGLFRPVLPWARADHQPATTDRRAQRLQKQIEREKANRILPVGI